MGRLSGTVRVPGDKSIGHRACILAALGAGPGRVRGLGGGADLGSTRRVLAALGVAQRIDGDAVIFEGVGLRGLRAPPAPLDCGNSGTTMRLMCGVLAGQSGTFVLDGDASLRRRPMGRVADTLRPTGACVDLPVGDRPPVRVTGGPLRGAEIHTRLPSAQLKSAALLAGLLAEGTTAVVEPGPSRDHTERMLAALGVPLRVEASRVEVDGVGDLPASSWRLPGDPSSAAFWLAAAALVERSDLTVVDVGLNPTRTGFLDVLVAMGASVERTVDDHWGGRAGGARPRARGGPARRGDRGGPVAPIAGRATPRRAPRGDGAR